MIFLQSLIATLALAAPSPSACAGPLTRAAVARCAAQVSPRIRADRQRVGVARGEANAARTLLPSNPRVAFTLGGRWNTVGARALNVSGTLSQQIEIGGQRRSRKRAAAANVDASESRVDITERDVVADALFAYYDVLAARAEVVVTQRGHSTAQKLHEVAAARAAAGIAAGIGVDLAAAEVAHAAEHLALARGRARVAEARLASALGLDPSAPLPEVRGDLTPLPAPATSRLATESAKRRPELDQWRAQRRASEGRLRLLRRERIPTPSLSFFAQTDGFNERVLGGGLAFPIPLPAPLGRTNKGEIQAARAKIRVADEQIAAARRALTLEAVVAYRELQARQDAAAAYTADNEAAARRTLDALSTEIEQGRIPVRDALLTQQTLIGLLLRAVESRHELCRASVALALAAGLPFDGDAR